MRFLFVSTHVDQTTGYSKVAYNMLRQLGSLSPKVKTFHFGFQRHPNRPGHRKVPEGVIAYDAAANEDPKEEGFGFNKIKEYVETVSPDVVMIYNDPLIICKFFEALKLDKDSKPPYKIWLYVDQVYHGINQGLIDGMNLHADRIYCFTDSWATAYAQYPVKDRSVVPQVLEHAVDPTMFTNMPRGERVSLRTNFKVPSDAVVYLNMNRNSQRKRLDLTIMGFVRILKRGTVPNAHLLIVTNVNPQSGSYYDVQRIFTDSLAKDGLVAEEFTKRLLIVDTAPPNVLNDESINQIYNMSDIGVNTSDGEGYGLCQLEHLYTGAPQVVTDVGSYPSFLNNSVAEIIETDPDSRYYFPGGMPLGLYAPTFKVESVADALESAAKNLATRRAAIETYPFKSWAKVCDPWLEDIHQAST